MGPEAQIGLKYVLDCGTVSTAPAPPSSAVRRGHVTSRCDSDNLTSCGPDWDAAGVDVPRGRVTSVREERHRSLAARRRRVPMPGWPGRRALGGRAGTKISNANRTRGMRLNSCVVDYNSVLILREGSEIKFERMLTGPLTFIPARRPFRVVRCPFVSCRYRTAASARRPVSGLSSLHLNVHPRRAAGALRCADVPI